MALLLLARQLWRGKHRALVVAVGLLAGSTALHVLKGLDVEEASFAAMLAILLVVRRKDFFAESDPASLLRFVRTVRLLAFGSFAFGLAAIWVNRSVVSPGFGIGSALEQCGAAMVGLAGPLRFSGRFDIWFPPTMAALGIATIAVAAFTLFRPVIGRLQQRPEEREEARTIVGLYDHDSLSYFALRGDKNYFFSETRNAFLTYRYIAGIALVSGDPIGPPEDLPKLVEAFIAHCRRHDWRIVVMAATESLLPILRTFGLRPFYLGDEAVLDVKTFTLEGRHIRNVRQSANHARKSGYSFRLLRNRDLDPEMRKALLAISAHWRGAEPERGFTMSLGRVMEEEDPRLAVAVAFDAEKRPQAFLQLTPYRHGRGWSLDVMRRTHSSPAGINEFLIVETVAALREQGCESLSLNFAAFAREITEAPGLHPVRRLRRRVLLVASHYFQIASLLSFNKKFHPDWIPRYLVFEEALDLPRAGIAILQAEALVRFPLLSRFV